MTATLLEKPEQSVPLSRALSDRYLSYALSTIMSRSLPDVRDGLKPVQRRLLFAMHQLKLDPSQGYKKAARVVGDVIGKFHPHGDSAVYEAMVRMAQTFATRYPLVDGHGNFGNIDGDSAAAMRYTEAKLTDVAQALLLDIQQDTVNFRLTYDNQDQEPVVLPACFPNLLANGTTGIAVGMATSVPPHNVPEICDALLHLIKSPNAQIKSLLAKMPGPDFPTGGVLLNDPDALVEAYSTGRGSVTVRGKWEVEKLSHGQYQIVVTEIPYHVQKARLIERIADLIAEKKVPLVADVRDESAEDVRIVIEPRAKTVEPEVLMETLFRQSELENRIPINLNVLDKNNVPRVMNLRELLQAFLDHRRDVLIRKSNFRLGEISRRKDVVSGYLVVYLNLDAVIKILREEDDPKTVMMKKFKLSDVQVEAILNMRLRALRKLEEMELRREFSDLEKEEKELKALLKSEEQQWEKITAEVKDIREKFGSKSVYGPRRTRFVTPPAPMDIDLSTLVEKEPVTVLCSAQAWVRAAKGHGLDPASLKYKEGDEHAFSVEAQSTDKIIFAASNGRFYTVSADKLPSARGFGEPLSLMIDLEAGAEIMAMAVYAPEQKWLVLSSEGKGFVVRGDTIMGQTRNGKIVMTVDGGAIRLRKALPLATGDDHVALVNSARKMLVLPLADVPELNKGQGVILQKNKDGTHLLDARAFAKAQGLSWMVKGVATVEKDLSHWLGSRATQGNLVPKNFPKSGRF